MPPGTRATQSQMLHIGRNVLSDPGKVIQSARFVQEEVSREAGRLCSTPRMMSARA